MAFEKLGGLVWSDNQAHTEKSWLRTAIVGSALAGSFYGASKYLTHEQNGHRPIDTLLYNMKQIANETPFEIGNTLRASEFLSPFASAAVHKQAGTPLGQFVWGADQIHNPGTVAYLERITGLNKGQLASHGLTGSAFGGANSLRFERNGNSAFGNLFVNHQGTDRLLSENMMLMSLNDDVSDFVSKSSGVHKAAKSVFQAADMWSHPDFYNTKSGVDQLDSVFATVPKTNVPRVRASMFPVPAPRLAGNTLHELERNTTYLRAFSAFSMERFNGLVSGTVEQIVGQWGKDTFSKITGLGTGVIPGTGNAMFNRIGMKAGALGAGVLGISQIDWARRNYGDLGHVAASALTSVGVGYLARKAGLSSRAQMIATIGSFATQSLMPGFDKGIVPGLATMAVNLDVGRANGLNPFNYYRRGLESYLPGITDWKTGALLGIGAAMASYGEYGGRRISNILTGQDGPRTVRQQFWSNISDYMGTANLKTSDRNYYLTNIANANNIGHTDRTWLRRKMTELNGHTEGAKIANRLWNQSSEEIRDQYRNLSHSIFNNLQQDIHAINRNIGGGLLDQISYQMKGLALQAKYAFNGVDIHNRQVREMFTNAGMKSPLGRAGLLFLGMTTAQQLLTGGILGSTETSADLKDIYAGRKLVTVKKGRFWEGGGTPYEGLGTEYQRPHWYSLMMNRVKEKTDWGEDEDTMSPVYKWYLKNFTYALEERNYYDRPYPISGAAFENIPVIGGLLSQTVGKLFKTNKLMHVDEWVQDNGGLEYGSVYQGWRREPAYNLGAEKPGVPISPYGMRYQLANYSDQFNELSGLPGFLINTVTNNTFGKDSAYPDGLVLESSKEIDSMNRSFWQADLGGMAFANEALRRIFPNGRSGEKKTNPIANTMPTWLPVEFQYGDPYTKIDWGEARLPGVGYASLHPELEGLDPEDYPLIYQYDILGNVAPFSKEFRKMRTRVYQQRLKGYMSGNEEAWLDQIDTQVAERFNGYNFQNNKSILPLSGATSSVWNSGKKLLRNAVAPIEYLTPMGFRPIQKLLGDRDPIEQYEWERLYGSSTAMWNKPITDWFRPAFYSAMHSMGFDGIPGFRQEANETNEYFDQLEFYKWMKLSEQARLSGNKAMSIKFNYMAGTTITGTNPNGQVLNNYWAIPQEDRNYFNAFSQAQGQDRNRILNMVPDNQKAIYQSIWNRLDSGDESIYDEKQYIDEEYMREQYYELQNQLEPMPGDDWIGYHQDVDIRDIKVKYVDQLGKDMHDYGLWEQQLNNVARQPYLEDSTDFLYHPLGIRKHLSNFDFPGGDYNVFGSSGTSNRAELIYNDNRDTEITSGLNGMIYGN